MITLLPFQEDKVAELDRRVRRSLSGGGGTIVFRSGTGSGKTVMLGVLLRRLLCEDPDLDLAAIWIAPFQLQGQGRRRLSDIGDSRLDLIEREELRTPILARSTVLFLNWASLNKTGNEFRRPNEKGLYLSSVAEATRRAGRGIVVVIDESDHSRDTVKSSEILNEIGAAVTVEMSATPSTRPDVDVDPADPRTAGLTRKRIYINEGLRPKPEENTDDVLLSASVTKRESLSEAYRDAGSSVNPLLLIQLPDAGEGEREMRSTVRGLASMNITEENGRLAIWLSDRKAIGGQSVRDISGDSRLMGLQGTVDVLIFKQAIARGWDCPRAQVLLKVRDASKSESFETQTVGRIMRMPEPRRIGGHYIDEALNYGYVFHGHRDYDPPIEDFPIATGSAVLRREIVGSSTILIACAHVLRTTSRLDNAIIARIVESGLNALGLDLSAGADANMVALRESGINLDARATESVTSGFSDGEIFARLAGQKSLTMGSPGVRTDSQFRLTIRRWFGSASNAGDFQESLYEAAKMALGISLPSRVNDLVMGDDNFGRFETAFVDAINNETGGLSSQEIVPYAWRPSMSRPYDVYPKSGKNKGFEEYSCEGGVGRYLYEPCFLRANRSDPEREWEKWISGVIEESGSLDWWVKNGETPGTDVCLVYPGADERLHNFFPDYQLGWSDGTLGLYETKDSDALDDPDNVAKLRTLQAWVAGADESAPRDGGLILPRNNKLYVVRDPEAPHGETVFSLLRR